MATILIVEDNAVTQRVLGLTLRSEGYQVVLAGDGIEALKRLEEIPVGLALVDILMPRMDGMALLRHLRAQERFSSLAVIMLTACGQEQYRSAALSLGADGFLNKPSSSRELLETVGRFVYAQT
jgi:CheY-like chemotaxis protein